MGCKQLFTWESKAKREARRKAYYAKVYPMGAPQQEWEKSTLKEIFPKNKHPEDLIFELIVLREALMNAQLDTADEDYMPESEGVARWKKSRMTNFLKDEERAVVMSMAYLEIQATCMEELPEAQQIVENAEQYKTKK